ncbi:MAG TPA: universal stress protein [Solirubrobacteraceae bacterium]|jgi:nucleotide-binding universal stress UspA family protein|nr:universal stress protein [Solirubrobacteraceae bacterium]
MNAADAPVLIAYDGSAPSRRAVREAARLLASKRMLVVTVWEPELAYVPMGMSAGPLDIPPAPMVDPEVAREVEQSLHERAEHVSRDGAELARSLGLEAEPLAVPDEGNVAGAILSVAEQRGVAAIVVGSRGLSGIRERLEGSTSKSVLKRAHCPVLVVHEPDEHHD